MRIGKNKLQGALSEGRVICGCGVMSGSPILVEILGYTGFDFVFIDTEHAPIGSDMILENLIRAAEASNIIPIVRVKENQEHYIRNALEAGAQGVVIPHIGSREAAEKAVKYSRFPPKGKMGVSTAVRSARYSCKDFIWEDYLRDNYEQKMVIALLEDQEFVANLEDILSVEGIDAVSFGPTDYLISLGINLPYDFNQPQLAEAFKTLMEETEKRNLPVMTPVIPPTLEQATKLQEMGVKMLLFGFDIPIISSAFNKLHQNVVSKIQ